MCYREGKVGMHERPETERSPAAIFSGLMNTENDHEFARDADRFMAEIFGMLAEFDPDELDTDLAMGVLSMTFADAS